MSTIKTTFIQHPSAVSPAIELSADGSILLPLSGIGDLADVDEGSGAVDGDVLTYDGTGDVWVPQGLVLPAAIGSNVVQTVKTDAFSTTSGTPTLITGLSATITPSSSSSKILIIISVPVRARYNCYLDVFRGATRLDRGNSSGNFKAGGLGNLAATQLVTDEVSGVILDSPATAAAVTYEVHASVEAGAVNVNEATGSVILVSSITVIEVAA